MLSNNHLSSTQSGKADGRVLAPSRPDLADFLLSSRFLLALLLYLALLSLQAVFAGEASAHALLFESQPADGAILDHSPEIVIATFSEELDSGLSTMRVFDAQGNQVDNGDGGVDLDDLDHLSMAVSLPRLSAGTYTVRWNALSAEDGDGGEGAFTFSIAGTAATETAAQLDGGRTTLIIGTIAAGVLLLLVLIVILARGWQAVPVEK